MILVNLRFQVYQFLSKFKLSEKADKDTLILIKKFNFLLIFKFVFQLKNIRILDKNFFLSSEASTRLRLRYYDFSSLNERENFINLSNENFENFRIYQISTALQYLVQVHLMKKQEIFF